MKIFRSFLIALTALVMASTAKAQQTNVKVDVPFDFYAGDRIYPAGEYRLSSMHSSDAIIRIDGSPEVQSANLPSNSCADTRPSTQTKLVFRRIGSNYFLYQVWAAGNSDGRQFPVSRAQMRLAENGKSENVVVAANTTK